jgi:GTPase Era involved in 16S rRNA processing
MQRFPSGPLSAAPCLLANDLTSIEVLRKRLNELATNPAIGLGRRSGKYKLDAKDIGNLHECITGQSPEPDSTEIVARHDNDKNDDVRSLLLQTIQLLNGPGRIYGSPGLQALEKWNVALDEESDRLRVSVVGDFKAGKSSLINAILQRTVCFVDEFEATGVRAIYSDGSPESVELTMDTGESFEIGLDDFLNRCARRDTKGIRSAKVTLQTGLPFDIADSPGLGTQTTAHADQAEEELRRTDLLAFTIDCSDPGGAQESTMVTRAKEIGLPMIVVLTKADILDEGEGQALKQYISDDLHVPAEDTFLVSARDYANRGDHGTQLLIERLVVASQFHRNHWIAAQKAKRREIAENLRIVLKNLLEQNEPNARYIAAELTYLEGSAADISRVAKDQWLEILRAEVSNIISGSEIQGSLTADDAKSAIMELLPSAVDKATSRFLAGLHALVRDEWRNELQAQANEFQRRLTALASSRANQADLSFLESERKSFEMRANVVSKTTENVVKASPLWHIGLGAASALLTSSLAPLAIGALAAAFLVKEQQTSSVLSSGLDPALSATIEDQLVGVFQSVTPEIDESIDRIIAEVAFRSLVAMASSAGRPDVNAVVLIEQWANNLVDELSGIEL